MNILITGANGFLGQQFTEHFSKTQHNVILAPRQTLDLTDSGQVDNFFVSRAIDVVIHTAVKSDESFDSLRANLSMFHNLKKHANNYRLMFSFGSGAEFDRYSNINNANEEDIYTTLPTDYYGVAKNLIAREIILHNSNIINLRLFGCFGTMEKNTRFIKNSLSRINKGLPIFIFQDRLMDFFYVGDIIKVVEHLMTKPKGHHIDYNMCYSEKATLAVIAQQLNSLVKNPVALIVE